MNNSPYEKLVRGAFSLASREGFPKGRDPADLGNIDRFSLDELPAVKVATGYAMEIYVRKVINDLSLDISKEEFSRIRSFTASIIAAEELTAINRIIDTFKETVIDKYISPRGNVAGKPAHENI